jgi:hypothetical protein
MGYQEGGAYFCFLIEKSVLAVDSAAVPLIPIGCQQAINSQFCQVSSHWLSPVELPWYQNTFEQKGEVHQ